MRSISVNRNGQTVLEFVMMAGLVIIMGALFLASAATVIGDAAEEERIAQLNRVGYMIQDELILATEVSDGYEREMVVPNQASSFVYTLQHAGSAVILSSATVTITYPLPNVTGTITKGTNTIQKNGEVIVS